MLLEIKNAQIGFEKVLIEKVDLELTSGKMIFLLGKNGQGKSCFLKTLSGLINPIGGTIYLNNKKLVEYNSLEKSQNIAFLTTDKISTDYLKVKDLIEIARTPFTRWNGKLSENDKQIIAQNISLFEIEYILEKEFNELSDGQKQKVLLCKSLSQSPNLVLLDEPTTYLDINSKVDFLKKLKEVIRLKKISAILTTHDLTLVKELADEIWYIEDNRLKAEVPEVFFTSGTLKRLFNLDLR